MTNKEFSFWITRLVQLLGEVQCHPDETSQLNLTNTMREYQNEVRQGLLCARLQLGEPWRRAATMTEWFQLQLDYAMTQFKNEPSEDRYTALENTLKEYRDAAFTGKIKR
jgi:hypothetical protein